MQKLILNYPSPCIFSKLDKFPNPLPDFPDWYDDSEDLEDFN